jgi:hypothetical protein
MLEIPRGTWDGQRCEVVLRDIGIDNSLMDVRLVVI